MSVTKCEIDEVSCTPVCPYFSPTGCLMDKKLKELYRIQRSLRKVIKVLEIGISILKRLNKNRCLLCDSSVSIEELEYRLDVLNSRLSQIEDEIYIQKRIEELRSE